MQTLRRIFKRPSARRGATEKEMVLLIDIGLAWFFNGRAVGPAFGLGQPAVQQAKKVCYYGGYGYNICHLIARIDPGD